MYIKDNSGRFKELFDSVWGEHKELDALRSTLANRRTLSKEEEKELETLREEYKQEKKRLKLNIFKALPSDVRQFAINRILVHQCFHQMSIFSHERSDRLEELEQVKARYSNDYFMDYGTDCDDGPDNGPLPDGLTIEDLQQAHLEACVEEELTNEG